MAGTQVAGHGGAVVRAERWLTSIGRFGRSLRRLPLVPRRLRLAGATGQTGLRGQTEARSGLSQARGRAKDAGMATAEYAIATLAAVGFAGLLIVVLRSDEVRGLLTGIIRQALSV